MTLNFKTNEQEVIQKCNIYLKEFINEEVIVLNDTRLVIIPSVLPYIEFVGSYDQRVLPILKNTHLVIAKTFYDEIGEYFQNLGLSQNVHIHAFENIYTKTLTQILCENDEYIEELKKLNAKKLLPFFVNDDGEKLAQKLGLQLIVNKEIFSLANDKLKLKQFLQKNNLPTIDGVYSNDPYIISQYFQKKKRYLFKDPLGVSGYGFWDNTENTLDELLQNYNNKELIIEEFIQKESSPSIQFFIPENKKEPIIFGMTDQILENGKIYLGNKSPSIYLKTSIGDELIIQSEKIIEYIQKLGYIGFGGIDFIISSNHKVFATEVNARFTGATYPAITMLFLKNSLKSEWEYTTIQGEKQSICDYLKNNSIQSKTESGIFPLCIAPLEKWGKAQILKIK